MDGINPTLAFLALMFGISGNARDDAASDPAMNIDLDRSAGCLALMIGGHPPQPESRHGWETFLPSAGGPSVGGAATAPEWAKPIPADIANSAFTGDPMALDHEADPLARLTATASRKMPGPQSEQDPCAPGP